MSTCRWSALIVLLAASAALAQPGEKPRVSAPEPQRQQASATSMTLVVVDYDIADKNEDAFPQEINELLKFIGKQERLQLQVQVRTQHLSDAGLAAATLLYMTGNTATLRISDAEKASLAKYLRGGGLLFAEDIRRFNPSIGLEGQGAGVSGTPFDRQFKALMRDPLVLAADGDRWETVPGSHPLYHAFYDFSDGPPLGGAPGGNVSKLEMLQLRGRPVVIFSDLNISFYWGDPMAESRERGLEFGANLLVYAMTQRLGR